LCWLLVLPAGLDPIAYSL